MGLRDRQREGPTVSQRVRWKITRRVRGIDSVLQRGYGYTDIYYLAVPLSLALCISVGYIATHQYPAHVSGVYLRASEAIIDNGFHLPASIPGYTENGLPFGYPPLMFYVGAILLKLGISWRAITILLPPLFIILYTIPLYYFARDLFTSRLYGALAAALIVVFPRVFYWHIVAGGWVRSGAFLWYCIGLWTGLNVFRDGRRQWVVPSGVLFGLTVLSHPVVGFVFGITYLCMWLTLDHTLVGFLRGAGVAASGGALLVPWLYALSLHHGIAVLLMPFGSAQGNATFNIITILQNLVDYKFLAINDFMAGWFRSYEVGTLNLAIWDLGRLGGLYLLLKRRYFLPAWTVAIFALVDLARFNSFMWPFLATPFLLEVVGPGIGAQLDETWLKEKLPSTIQYVLSELEIGVGTGILLVVVLAVGTGAGVYVATNEPVMTPAGLTDDQLDAMKWVQNNTASNATFITIGGVGEWFPYHTNRRILVSPWGTEWTGDQESHIYTLSELHMCRSAPCITNDIITNNATASIPDYLYVRKEAVNIGLIWGEERRQPVASLKASENYKAVYENDGCIILEVKFGPETSRVGSPMDAGSTVRWT